MNDRITLRIEDGIATLLLNRPAKLLVVPEPLSFACPVIDFSTLEEAATYAAERLQDAHVVWALTPDLPPWSTCTVVCVPGGHHRVAGRASHRCGRLRPRSG